MQRNFVELQKFLEMNYPQLVGRVKGGVYPPPTHAVVIANIGSLAMWGGLLFSFLGDKIFGAFGMAPPGWYRFMKENPMQVFIGLFVFNSVAGSMAKTGAFEVYLNGETVFSRLETGRFPTANDIVDGIKRTSGLEPMRRF